MRRGTGIALIPLVALLVLVGLFLSLKCQVKVGHALHLDSIDAVAAKIERLRLIWGASAFAVAAALIANAGLALASLWMALRHEETLTRWCSVFVSALIAGVAAVVVSRYGSAGPFADELLSKIWAAADVDVARLTAIGNAWASVTVTFMLAALCALALQDRLRSIAQLSTAIRLWHLSLSGAATLLAAGVVEVWSLYRWGAASASPADAASVEAVADGFAFAAAMCFTVLLAAMYLPVAALHSHWLAQATAEQSQRTPSVEVDKWLAQHGIKSSPISVGTAILLPAIAFLLTTLLKKVVGSAA